MTGFVVQGHICQLTCFQMDIHGKIRDVLAETVRGDGQQGQRSLSEEDFIHALQRRGIVDDVMKYLHFTNVVTKSILIIY